MLLCLLAKCCKDSIFALADKFHIRSNNVLNADVTTIRDMFWSNLVRPSVRFVGGLGV